MELKVKKVNYLKDTLLNFFIKNIHDLFKFISIVIGI